MRRPAAVLLGCALAGCPSGGADYQFTVVMDDLPGVVLSFWGDSASDLYAVGGDLGDPGQAQILWYDGDAWHRQQADAPTLWWVHGFSRDDVWAVGEAGTIVHFDGSTWTTVRTGSPYTLWGIWGASPDDLWAVGGDVSHTVPSVILHRQGADWVEVPEVARDSDMYFKIWGSSAADIWVVSERGEILHYDGSAWTDSDSGTTSRLITVTGRGPDDVWAVGGVTESILLHYDGAAWQRVDLQLSGGLMGVWTAPGQPVFVAGFSGVMALGDDSGWTPIPFLTPDCLHATWGDGNGTILGGGGNLLAGAAGTGIIVGTGPITGGPIADP